jgi:hypothetical protein
MSAADFAALAPGVGVAAAEHADTTSEMTASETMPSDRNLRTEFLLKRIAGLVTDGGGRLDDRAATAFLLTSRGTAPPVGSPALRSPMGSRE